MSKNFQGRVKSVLSGDTIVLTNPNHKGKTAPEERIVSLAMIQAPRNEEAFAFDSREYLRKLLVGKIVSVKVFNTAPSGRSFVDISSPIFDSLIAEVVSNGWAKLRERINEEEAEALKDLELKARTEGLGIWNSKPKTIQVIDTLPESVIEKSKATPLHAIVERVLSGDRLKLRVLFNLQTHADILVHVAGVRAPSAAPGSEESKYFIEVFELAKDVTVSILGELSNGIPVAKITSKFGNLSDRLIKEGLAEVDDRQSLLIGSAGMSYLRELQQAAKAALKGQWAGITTTTKLTTHKSSGDSDLTVGSKISATVARVISADTVNLYLANGTEATVSLTSVRAPRQNDPATSPFIATARDFVRKKIIGKKVTVSVEAVRPKSDNFDERPLVNITLPNGSSLSSSIIESGWATVIRHRRDDTDRSPQWDLLMELEQAAIKAKKGIHGKAPEAGKIIEASENKTRASSLLHSLKNKSSISGVVEAVINYNRFRIYVPRDSMRLTLVLGGLANTSNSSKDLSSEAFDYVSRRVTQRDIHFNVYNNDNTGAFVGNLFIQGQSAPLQVTLLSHGLAKIHEYSLTQTGFEREFVEAQADAQKETLGYWKDYDPSEADSVQQVTKAVEELKISPKYHNVKVTYVSDDGVVYFRLLNGETDTLKTFQDSMRSALQKASTPKTSARNGEIVVAKDSENGLLYRARIVSHNKGSYDVQHIDYGVLDTVPLSSLLTLPQQYGTSVLSPQAHSSKLALIHLPPTQSYLTEAIDTIYDLTEATEELVAVEYRTNPSSSIECDVSLVDFSAIKNGGHKDDTINRELVKNGLAIVDRKITAFEKAMKSEYDALLQIQEEAKRQHVGCWRFGDIEEDEDL